MVDGQQVIKLTDRPLHSDRDGKYCAMRSTPTINLKNANPNSKFFPDTARHLVTYYKKFVDKIGNSIPTFQNDDEWDSFWIKELHDTFPGGEGFPDPFVKRILQHYLKIAEENDSSDTSVDMNDGSSTSSDFDEDDADEDTNDNPKGLCGKDGKAVSVASDIYGPSVWVEIQDRETQIHIVSIIFMLLK